LNRCFFGRRLLVTDGSIVNLVMPGEVVDVAETLGRLDETDFSRRYDVALPESSEEFDSAAGSYFDELYEKLAGLRDFYQSAAREGRGVLFYTDDPLDYFFKPGWEALRLGGLTDLDRPRVKLDLVEGGMLLRGPNRHVRLGSATSMIRSQG
jgi:Domain of unknown function (DUF1877)